MRSALNLCIALGLAFAIGCGKPPVEELNAARAALDAARQAEAEVYAPDTYRSASNTLNDANAKSEAKDYEGARTAAIQARELADRARSEAQTAKQQTRDDAQTIVNRVTSGLSDVRIAMGSAPRGKGADDDLDQINADLSQAESSLNNARTHLSSGKYRDALTEARSAETKLGPTRSSVQAAVEKTNAWKERNKAWYLRL